MNQVWNAHKKWCPSHSTQRVGVLHVGEKDRGLHFVCMWWFSSQIWPARATAKMIKKYQKGFVEDRLLQGSLWANDYKRSTNTWHTPATTWTKTEANITCCMCNHDNHITITRTAACTKSWHHSHQHRCRVAAKAPQLAKTLATSFSCGCARRPQGAVLSCFRGRTRAQANNTVQLTAGSDSNRDVLAV